MSGLITLSKKINEINLIKSIIVYKNNIYFNYSKIYLMNNFHFYFINYIILDYKISLNNNLLYFIHKFYIHIFINLINISIIFILNLF
jgi:hypothetical protein